MFLFEGIHGRFFKEPLEGFLTYYNENAVGFLRDFFFIKLDEFLKKFTKEFPRQFMEDFVKGLKKILRDL